MPLIESFKVQATTTQIFAFLMSLIDGRRSVRDMAAVMEERRLMPKAEAEASLREFLIKMYDESRTPPNLYHAAVSHRKPAPAPASTSVERSTAFIHVAFRIVQPEWSTRD